MPVILEVEHTTTYRYRNPVVFLPHRVAFHPRTAHDIKVLSASLEVSPHSKQHWMHDVFSNSLAVVEPLVPANELRFAARFTIEHHGVANEELPISPEAEYFPFSYTAERLAHLSTYLPLQYPDDAGECNDLTEIVAAVKVGAGVTAVATGLRARIWQHKYIDLYLLLEQSTNMNVLSVCIVRARATQPLRDPQIRCLCVL